MKRRSRYHMLYEEQKSLFALRIANTTNFNQTKKQNH